MFEKVSADMIEKLKGIFGEARVRVGDLISADYAHDELPGGDPHLPEVVVEALRTEEVSALLKMCNDAKIPVTVRGAGTGQAGGSVPVKGGVVLSVKGMNRILEYNQDEHTILTQPGVLLQEIKVTAESHGMYYPPDPGEPTATIGGNAATNAGGPRAVKYGRTHDYIADAVIVLADGTVTRLAGNEKVLGSEGTLGVITELTLKLAEKPAANAILLLPFLDIAAAVNAARVITDNGFAPSVVELIDTDIVEFSGRVTGNPVFPVEIDGERVAATLMVEIEGSDDDDVMEKMEAFAGLAEEGQVECLDILVGDTPTMIRDFWAAHSAFHTSMESGAKSFREINIDVPTDAIAEMIDFAKTTGKEKGLNVLLHSHVGSGGIHIFVVSDMSKDELSPIFKAFSDAVYAKCSALGGNIAGEYGIGYSKVEYVPQKAKAEFAVYKSALDPNGILNPGKII